MGATIIFIFGIVAAATVCPSLESDRLLCSFRRAETPGLNSYFFFPGRHSGRHRNCVGLVTDHSPLYAEGLYFAVASLSLVVNHHTERSD